MAERPDETRPRDVLVVEDNPADMQLTIEALKRSPFVARVAAVTDGEAALAFLRREGPYNQVPRPELVFLDGSLPKLSGFEVLAAIKADFVLRDIPVIMFSSSASQEDVVRAYKGQIAAYIVKPFSFDDYSLAIKAVEELWFRRAALPGRSSAVPSL